MTANELRHYFNTEFSKNGIDTPWPETFEVDAETYANVCQFTFNMKANFLYTDLGLAEVRLYVGRNKGIKFKDVELILRKS